jgi:hypothetical protein
MSMQCQYIVDVGVNVRLRTAATLKGSAVFETAAIANWLALPFVKQTGMPA